MSKITYQNKIPGSQFTSNDANEIKESVNTAYDELSLNYSNDESKNLFLRGNSPKTYTSKKYGIITAGQSNTDGRVPLINAPSWLNQSDPSLLRVNMWNDSASAFQTFKLGLNTGADNNTTTLWGYDMVLYHLLQQYLNDDIYVIKRSRGGTAIDLTGTNGGGYWQPYFERVTSGIVLTSSFEQRIRNAIASALGANIKIKAFVWHQGEGDYMPIPASLYYQNLKNVISYIRGVIGDPKLPFIMASISTLSAQFSQTVKDAQIDIASEDPFVYFIDMGAAPLLDAYHFNAASSESLGTAIFNIIKNF